MHCRTANEVTASFILIVRSLVTFGKLRTSWVIPEKNGTSGNIFGHSTNSANRALSKHPQNIFGNTTYPANRTSLKKSIFGNPTNSTNRTSSVTFENLRKNPNNSASFILIVRSFVTFGKLRTSWVTPEKNGTSWNIFGHSINSANRALSKHP